MVLNRWLENEPKETLICAVTSVAALILSITGALKSVLPFDIAWVAIVLCGVPILVGAFCGVVFERDIKADLLVSLALIASAATGEFFAAGEVALIMQIGSLLEDYTSGKAREGIEKLVKLTPQTARVRRGGGERVVPAEEVAVGDTLVVLAGETIPVDGALAGFAALSDTVREDAGATVRKLNAAGVTPMLLTGGNEAAARAISAEVGIADVRANLLPEDKMRVIKDCAGGSEPVCMIGDGVNDALALSAADAGVAMGGIGSDIAIESADAVLVSDEIKRLPYLFSLTRKVMQKVRVNIIASLVINLSAVLLSALGVLTPVTGALWHNCGSVFVVVNAALLLRLKDDG